MCGNNIHEIKGPFDRLPSGQCRACDHNRQRNYRARQRLGASILKQLEQSGLKVVDLKANSGYALALSWLAETDESALIQMERQHPSLVAKVRTQLERVDNGTAPLLAS